LKEELGKMTNLLFTRYLVENLTRVLNPVHCPHLTNPLTAKLGELEKRFGVPFRMHAFDWQSDRDFALPPGFRYVELIDELYDFTTEVMRVISKEYRYVESYGISHFY
jgi:hypothetical protein